MSNLFLIAFLQVLLLRGGLSSPSCIRRSASYQCQGLAELPTTGGSNVTRVDVRHGRITTVGYEFFQQFPDIRTLLASHNHISEVADGAFHLAADLIMVDLSFNRLTTLRYDTFADNGRLDVVYLTGNPLVVPSGVPVLQSDSLKKLYAGHTLIQHFTETSFSLMRNVQFMNFEGNAVARFIHSSIKSLYKLEKLVLGKPDDADCYRQSVFQTLQKIKEHTDLDAEICPSVATSTTVGPSTVTPNKEENHVVPAAGNIPLLQTILLVICSLLIVCNFVMGYKLFQFSRCRYIGISPTEDKE